MQAVRTEDKTVNISREKLLDLFGQAFGGQSYPEQEDPQPPGQWDAYIIKALRNLKYPFPEPDPHPEWEYLKRRLSQGLRNAAFGPTPEPWATINPYSFADLNPQPLPPRALFLAAVTQEVIDRAVLIQDVAEALIQTGEEKAIIVVSGSTIHKFTEELDGLCPRLKDIIFPKPTGGDGGVDPEHPDPILPNAGKLSSFEILVVASVFRQNARTVVNKGLSGVLSQSAAKLAEQAVSEAV